MANHCDARWRALRTSCVVTARHGLGHSDPCLLLRLSNALKRMDAANAHAVLSALALPRTGAGALSRRRFWQRN